MPNTIFINSISRFVLNSARILLAGLCLVTLVACEPVHKTALPPNQLAVLAQGIAAKANADRGRRIHKGLVLRGGQSKGNIVQIQYTVTDRKNAAVMRARPAIANALFGAAIRNGSCRNLNLAIAIKVGLDIQVVYLDRRGNELLRANVTDCDG